MPVNKHTAILASRGIPVELFLRGFPSAPVTVDVDNLRILSWRRGWMLFLKVEVRIKKSSWESELLFARELMRASTVLKSSPRSCDRLALDPRPREWKPKRMVLHAQFQRANSCYCCCHFFEKWVEKSRVESVNQSTHNFDVTPFLFFRLRIPIRLQNFYARHHDVCVQNNN